MATLTDSVQNQARHDDIARNFRKAVLLAICLHIILLYGFIESKPERACCYAALERTPIVLATLPPVQTPAPAQQKPPRTRASRPSRVSLPTPAVLENPPRILPESMTITPDELMPDLLDPSSLDWPEPAPPDPGPYAVSYPGIVPPVCTHRVIPEYPDAAQRLGIRGYTILSVIIDADGRVTSMDILRSFNSACDASAVNAVTKWRFEPATLNGVPVPVEMVLTISFVTH